MVDPLHPSTQRTARANVCCHRLQPPAFLGLTRGHSRKLGTNKEAARHPVSAGAGLSTTGNARTPVPFARCLEGRSGATGFRVCRLHNRSRGGGAGGPFASAMLVLVELACPPSATIAG